MMAFPATIPSMSSSAYKHIIAGVIWCVLLGIAYLIMDSQMKPKVATVQGAATEIVIPRSRDGHFYVAGSIGGKPVSFMVDTGASLVAVSRTVAAGIGLPGGNATTVTTAGGRIAAEEVAGQRIVIGGIVINEARVLVLPGAAPEALLGQNVLRHMEVSQSAERMILRAKPQ